jgi:formylglycine-generating enzyme required for sulfatase activity
MNNRTKFLDKAIKRLHKAVGIINKTKLPKTPFTSNATFEFEVVTVNEHGEIINRTSHQANQEIIHLNGVAIEMVYVPGGTFLMGSPETEKNRRFWLESPQHPVTVAPFYLGKYPVTQSQWQAVMGNNPAKFNGKTRPVEWVYYDDAIAFCEKLSKIMGKSYHLPSEAQWCLSCRDNYALW